MTQEANDLTDAYLVMTHITFVLHFFFFFGRNCAALIFDIPPTEQQHRQK